MCTAPGMYLYKVTPLAQSLQVTLQPEFRFTAASLSKIVLNANDIKQKIAHEFSFNGLNTEQT